MNATTNKMKSLAFTIAFIVFHLTSNSQQASEISLNTERLLTDIKSYSHVESRYLGCYGGRSSLFEKVDSLQNLLGWQDFQQYFSDSSHVLKYFAFLSIAKYNDIVAFEKLQSSISDTSEIGYEFGQHRGSTSFNSLLAYEYYKILKMKYYYGGNIISEGQLYSFPKKNRRQWKIKKAELDKLLAVNKVDTWLFKILGN